MTGVFLSSQASKLILLLCECTTKKILYLLLEKKQKHIILGLFFNENKDMLDLEK
jgi:hypothetical protein